MEKQWVLVRQKFAHTEAFPEELDGGVNLCNFCAIDELKLRLCRRVEAKEAFPGKTWCFSSQIHFNMLKPPMRLSPSSIYNLSQH